MSSSIFSAFFPRGAVQTKSFRGGAAVPWLTTPAVQAAAAAYFNCPSVPGGPLEAMDTGSHWELRLLPVWGGRGGREPGGPLEAMDTGSHWELL